MTASGFESEGPDGVRLQKVLAGAGVASRRVSEQLIAADIAAPRGPAGRLHAAVTVPL